MCSKLLLSVYFVLCFSVQGFCIILHYRFSYLWIRLILLCGIDERLVWEHTNYVLEIKMEFSCCHNQTDQFTASPLRWGQVNFKGHIPYDIGQLPKTPTNNSILCCPCNKNHSYFIRLTLQIKRKFEYAYVLWFAIESTDGLKHV